MKKQGNWFLAGAAVLVLTMLAACNGEESKENFEAADKVAYEYIVAKVERDDDRMKELLTEEGKEYAKSASLLKDGEHLYPGQAEEMKDHYEIMRYDNLDKEDLVYYRVKYEIQNNDLSDTMTEYIEVVKSEKGEWRLTKPLGISNDVKADLFSSEEDKENGTIVHEYKSE